MEYIPHCGRSIKGKERNIQVKLYTFNFKIVRDSELPFPVSLSPSEVGFSSYLHQSYYPRRCFQISHGDGIDIGAALKVVARRKADQVVITHCKICK